MRKLVLVFVGIWFISTLSYSQNIDTSSDRVKTNLNIPFKRIGTLKPKHVKEIESSNWSILRGPRPRLCNYDSYKEYLPHLDIQKIRLQGGWAKTEKQKGIYDWAWLDHIIDDAFARGLKPWLQTSYGNPIYEGGGGFDLKGGLPTSPEALIWITPVRLQKLWE